jgi:hypothetical protein
MDTNFQTSFIPKKPLAEERVAVTTTHSSIFGFLATLIFISAIAASAGLYFYRTNLAKTIMSQQVQLNAARNAFEPSLITELKRLDRRITSANTILNSHIAVSPIFEALELNTLKTIQFTKFTYTTPANSKLPIKVELTGRARGYAAIALESDQLATNKYIRNSLFSDLNLNEQTGMVQFLLTFDVDPDLVRFTNNLEKFTAVVDDELVPLDGM